MLAPVLVRRLRLRLLTLRSLLWMPSPVLVRRLRQRPPQLRKMHLLALRSLHSVLLRLRRQHLLRGLRLVPRPQAPPYIRRLPRQPQLRLLPLRLPRQHRPLRRLPARHRPLWRHLR